VNWKSKIPLFAVFAVVLIIGCNIAFAANDETWATKVATDGQTRYVSHAITTQVNSNEAKYTVNQHHQWYGSDNLWHTNTAHDITETMRFVDYGSYVGRLNKLVVDDEQAVNSDAYQIWTTNTAYEVEQTWLLDSNQWSEHEALYTQNEKKYNVNGLISPTAAEKYFMTAQAAPTGTVQENSAGQHFLVRSTAADGTGNKFAYFNNLVTYEHPANAYETAFMEARNQIWTFETWIREDDPTQFNILGQFWSTTLPDGTIQNNCIYIEYRDAFTVYHELGHMYHHDWTEAQCDAYAESRCGYPCPY
jgi:hypothetical protein